MGLKYALINVVSFELIDIFSSMEAAQEEIERNYQDYQDLFVFTRTHSVEVKRKVSFNKE